MNAQLYASHLGHIPQQIMWVASTIGLAVVVVNPAYSSQECPHCHYTHRDNRPSQETFSCRICGYADNADIVAAKNLLLLNRWNDEELAKCISLDDVKALLTRRHEQHQAKNAYS